LTGSDDGSKLAPGSLDYGRAVYQPAASALAAATAAAGPDAVVESIRRLTGGTHADTHLVRLSSPDLEVVLREFPTGDTAAQDEARVLQALDGLDGLTPRLLACDVAAEGTTRPWVLISRLPGHADITPRDPEDAARQLGQALARLHTIPPTRFAALSSVVGGPVASRADLHGPAAHTVNEHWDRLIATAPVLTHRDFWSGNVLWDNGVLSGVVDWTGGGIGPAGLDVGWCRLDLYLLYDEHIADTFLAAYQTAAGNPIDARIWDLWAVARSDSIIESWEPNYSPLGREDLTASELRRRHSQWTTHLTSQRD
jgi:aminoglycoside phosphotransferase (APT) family kinase protein